MKNYFFPNFTIVNAITGMGVVYFFEIMLSILLTKYSEVV
jgi:hypothetical protein